MTVIDDWQRRGLGTLLLEVTSARAREDGITTLTALMLASNQEMMDVLKSLGPVRIVDRDARTVEIEMPIPSVGLSPALSKLLRIAARNDVAVALAARHGRLGARRHALGGENPLDDAADSQQRALPSSSSSHHHPPPSPSGSAPGRSRSGFARPSRRESRPPPYPASECPCSRTPDGDPQLDPPDGLAQMKCCGWIERRREPRPDQGRTLVTLWHPRRNDRRHRPC